jgi:hypothetical protein
MREVLEREHPEAVVSLSSDVLREYREYERSVTTLVDAAVKPIMRRYIDNLSDRLGRQFSVMKSNGGVLSASEVVHQPITTVLSGPAAAEERGTRSGVTGLHREPTHSVEPGAAITVANFFLFMIQSVSPFITANRMESTTAPSGVARRAMCARMKCL